MKSRFSVGCLTGVCLFALGVGSTLVAQTIADSVQRVEKHRADLSGAPGMAVSAGEGPGMEVIVSTADYNPGDAIDLHSHHGLEALYVIQGALIKTADNSVRELPTGGTGLNLRDIDHAGFTVVGDTALKLFTVHVVDKNKPLYVYTE